MNPSIILADEPIGNLDSKSGKEVMELFKRINPYTIRFICKNGTEINCNDKFTTTSDKQYSNNTATREKQHTMAVE